MISFEPNIAVVDDEQLEIQGILDHYQNDGIGCKFFNASLYDGDEHPTKPYSDINLIFLDLYYSSQSFDHELCSAWVRKILPEKSFYILILWTKDSSKANAVISELKKFKRSPFVYLVKSKTEYTIDGEKKYDFSKLFDEINAELEKIPALSEIGIWKKSLKKSANEIIGGLTKDSESSVFVNKLKKIIISHGGTFIKSSPDDKRKRTILFDALDNVLISNSKKSVHAEDISQINKDSLYKLDNTEEYNIDKELNSWFHFKLESEISQELIAPGLISEFKENDWKKMYSIHDDPIVLEYLSKQVGDKVSIKSIVMLLSRPCDIAQNKYGKNLKLLSGLKIVNPVRKENAKKEFQKGSSNVDSIKMLDHLYMNDKEDDVTLLFDFRYNFSIPEEIFKNEFDNIKIFNKELLSEIQVEYSSYSSRLGITQVI